MKVELTLITAQTLDADPTVLVTEAVDDAVAPADDFDRQTAAELDGYADLVPGPISDQ